MTPFRSYTLGYAVALTSFAVAAIFIFYHPTFFLGGVPK